MGLKKASAVKLLEEDTGLQRDFHRNIGGGFGNNDNGFRPAAGSSCWEKPCLLTHFYCNKHGAENQNNECKRKHLTAVKITAKIQGV